MAAIELLRLGQRVLGIAARVAQPGNVEIVAAGLDVGAREAPKTARFARVDAGSCAVRIIPVGRLEVCEVGLGERRGLAEGGMLARRS